MTPHYVANTRIPTLVFPTSVESSRHVALMFESLIRQNNSAGRPTVLGLATGSTPLGVYRELIRLYNDAELDFARVVTFNLDEYYGLLPGDAHSYHAWMHDTFFRHVNIQEGNIHIPKGCVEHRDLEDECAQYENKIRRAGGIDLQILGIGRTGHVGFNEPGSSAHSRTRVVTLNPITRRDASEGFFGEQNVPHQALTMGVGTILDAKRIVIMAFGEHKAPIVQRAVENEPSEAVAASFLQRHRDATFILDEAAAADLTAISRPWTVGPMEWTPKMIRRAVIWLSLKVGKALQKLSDDDFQEHELYTLLREHGPAEALGRRVFGDLQATISDQPGRPIADCGLRIADFQKGEGAGSGNAESSPKSEVRNPKSPILVFSPHPDDDVISMGGTLIQLVEQGHEVHVAYMTSGNIAVFDHDAWRYVDFVEEFNRLMGIEEERAQSVRSRVQDFLASKKPGQPDSEELLGIKTLIRKTEAKAAAQVCGIPSGQLVFMNMRFYRTGTIAKRPIHPEDIADTITLLKRLQPAQIYVAGDLSDPHGTHRVCANAIFQAVREVWKQGQNFEVWLYRGAWQEWDPDEIDRVVPMSPNDLERKKLAIFRHQSQKDRAMYPGSIDRREFWQRAEDRNRGTAKVFDQLGLPEYYALEGFVQWRGE